MKIKFIDSTSFIKTNSLSKLTHQYIGSSELAHWRQRLKSWLLREILKMGDNSTIVVAEWNNTLLNKFGLDKLKYLGKIYNFYEGAVFVDYPPFYIFRINFKTSKSESDLYHGLSYSITKEKASDAVGKSLWEVVERQATYYDSLIKKVTYPTLIQGDASWLYELVPHFTNEQIKSDTQLVAQATDLKEITGFYANCLTSGPKRFLPISCFYWGRELSKKEKIIHHITTSGSGGGATKEQALLSGLYELIERDLFLLYWLSGLSPQHIEITTEQGELYDHIREAKRRYNLEVYFLKLQYDLPIPTVVCIIVDPIMYRISLGGRSSLSTHECLYSSYTESLADLYHLRKRGLRTNESLLTGLIEKRQWGNRNLGRPAMGNLYCSELGINTIKNLWLKSKMPHISAQTFLGESVTFPNHKQELKFVIDAFNKLVKEKGEGYNIYEHHFESELTRLFESHVAKAFVPAFLKLHLEEKYVTPVSDRLWSFARKHGLSVSSESDLNTLPHFFP